MNQADLAGIDFPFPFTQGRPRRRFFGYILIIFAFAVTQIVGIINIVSLGLERDFGLPPGWKFLSLILMFVALYWAFYLFALGRRAAAPRPSDKLKKDHRSPILLLRSFEDDDLVDPSIGLLNPLSLPRYEERLVSSLRSAGPAVAIGRPGESEPALGAARFYVGDENWQNAVIHVMKQAVAVIAVVGRTEGLWWEIEEALRRVPPERLLLFFPYPLPAKFRTSWWRLRLLTYPLIGGLVRLWVHRRMENERQERYDRFRSRFSGDFQHALPSTLGRHRFLHFDKNGHPEFIPMQGANILQRILSFNIYSHISIPFKYELRGFSQKIRQTWVCGV